MGNVFDTNNVWYLCFWKLPIITSWYTASSSGVQVDYSSAAAYIDEVTQVIEDVIGGAEIKNIDSKSENGRSTINVEFEQV